MLEGVVAADPIPSQALLETLDLVPVQLDPGRDHQEIVTHPGAVGGQNGVFFRLELRHRIPDPGGPGRDEGGFGTLADFLRHLAAADKRPERLIEVPLGRLNNRHV